MRPGRAAAGSQAFSHQSRLIPTGGKTFELGVLRETRDRSGFSGVYDKTGNGNCVKAWRATAQLSIPTALERADTASRAGAARA